MPTALTLTPKDPAVTGALTVTGQGTGVVFNGDGTTTVTTGGRVQASSSGLQTTSGWWAARMKMGFASAASSNAQFASWGTAVGDRIGLAWNAPGTLFQVASVATSATSLVQAAPSSFLSGDAVTVIGAWTPTVIAVSVNGASFVTNSTTGVTAFGATFDIGSRSDTGGTVPANSSFVWFAAGKGTLTDTDAAALHGFGNTDPTWSQLSTTAWRTTLLWTCVDSNLTAPLSLTAIS